MEPRGFFARVSIAAIVLLSGAAWAQEQQAPNLIILGWDGSDREAVELQLSNGNLPHLEDLIGSEGGMWPVHVFRNRYFGLSAEREIESNTSTKPGWVEVVTGVDPVLYGIRTNKEWNPLPDGETIFEKLRQDNPDLVVGWITAKPGNTGLNCPNPQSLLAGLCDDVPKEWRKFQKQPPNDWVGRNALKFIDANANQQFAAFITFAFPDWAGHYCPDVEFRNTGFRHGYITSMISTPENGKHTGCFNYRTGEWISWGGGTDFWTGEILAALDSYGIRDNTIIVVTSDHGFVKLDNPISTRGHANSPDSWAASNFDLAMTMPYARLSDIAPTVLGIMREIEKQQNAEEPVPE